MVDRAELGLDFVKITWTNDMPEDNQSLRKHVDRIGARIVLCRCDTPQAIDYGRQIGIDLFQGQHVDALLTSRAGAPSSSGPRQAGRP